MELTIDHSPLTIHHSIQRQLKGVETLEAVEEKVEEGKLLEEE